MGVLVDLVKEWEKALEEFGDIAEARPGEVLSAPERAWSLRVTSRGDFELINGYREGGAEEFFLPGSALFPELEEHYPFPLVPLRGSPFSQSVGSLWCNHEVTPPHFGGKPNDSLERRYRAPAPRRRNLPPMERCTGKSRPDDLAKLNGLVSTSS